LARNIGAVAVVALLIAAATAGAQAVIDGGDVRNNSLTGKDVKNKSLTKKDFRGSVRGPRGLRGPQGAQGVQGAQGPAGPAGPSGATNVTVRSGPVSPSGSSTASCNPGERAVGGGGVSVAGFLDSSRPLQDPGQTPTAWTASAGGADVQAWVVCAAP
jgi:hypothetical protein